MADKPTPIPVDRQPPRMQASTQKTIRAAVDKVVRLKKERKSISDKIAETRSTMETLGIPKRAFDQALKYFEDDSEKRMGFDAGYAAVRAAVDLPVEAPLFDGFEERPKPEGGAGGPTGGEPGAGGPTGGTSTGGDQVAAAGGAPGAPITEFPSTAVGDQMIRDVAQKLEQEEGAKVLDRRPQSEIAKEKLAAAGMH